MVKDEGIMALILPNIAQLAETVGWMIQRGIDTSLVPKGVRKNRMAICKGCEFYIGVQCKICACVMPVKTALVYDPSESARERKNVKTKCPKGKWGPYLSIT